ncbi:YeiH family protein [Georhizobium sp. MAB10]|uniref:YeiH family protein n=1 Tax=Georhizobium sp. MAB10 TaxID=3028319 RepID=UPI003855F7A8
MMELAANRFTSIWQRGSVVMPGALVAFIVAAAALFLSEHYGGPAMLFALLLGMALHFLATHEQCKPGIEFTARRLLRIGVALLGARITVDQIFALGAGPLILVASCMALTIFAGLALARFFGRDWTFGILTGGAVAICGASAALAISAVLPRRPGHEQNTLFTVVAVTSLSTIAMIAYPILFSALGFDDTQIGILIGATIHDVAQVVGAGYAVSDLAGDTATYVKLLRVALLPVIVIGLSLLAMPKGDRGAAPWPMFALAFVLILVVNSVGLIPPLLREVLNGASQWLLIAAIAALGIKTSLQAMFSLGGGHLAIVVFETLLIAGLAMTLIVFL